MLDFTVLIPVYNTNPIHLREAVLSVINQTLPPKAILIIDDGSTKTETIYELGKLAREHSIIEVKELDRNYGTSHALNVGHGMITTEWVALMGSDDISLPKRFEKQYQFLKRKPNTDVLGTQIMAFYDHDQKRKNIFTSKHKSKPIAGKGWQTNHGTVMYRNSAVKEVGGYNVDMRRAQDIHLFNKMMVAGKVFYNTSEVLYHWRRFLRT